ncbi:MAG: AN1-type zinc finger domain-containing protein [Promethearchaeia archaeon]
MNYCEYCGERITGGLPFRCKYCGGTFCKKHRLPENHECSFELKIPPVTASNMREVQPLYTDAIKIKPSPYDSGIRRHKEIKKYIKQQQKLRKQAQRSREKAFYPGLSMNYKYTFLLIVIVGGLSLSGYILKLFGLSHVLYFSLWGLVHLYFWVIFTGFFIAPAYSILFPLFLFIYLLFLYLICRNIERFYGSKFLLRLYLFCSGLTGLFYILIRLLLGFVYPIDQVAIPYGFFSGAMLGLIAFICFNNMDRHMTFICMFIPMRLSGRSLLVLLILWTIIQPFFSGFIVYGYWQAIFFADIGGIIGAYLIYYSNFKYRKMSY